MQSSTQKIAGYEIIDEISRGAMGIVYRVAKDGQRFALKVLRQLDIDNVSRFKKEAASIARLVHPNLVRLVEAGEVDGAPYIVMELLEGQSLEKLVKGNPVAVEGFKKIATSSAQGLSEIHKNGMVHRDIKTANIIQTKEGQVKIIDLGLAGSLGEIEKAKTEIVGTILYASPEQSRVLRRPVDNRSDLYSLGVTLYECLTGAPPFLSDDMGELMQMHASALPPPILERLPNTHPVAVAIVEKLLRKDPDDRYQSADGLLHDLEQMEALENLYRKTGQVKLGARDRYLPGANSPLFGRDRELNRLNELWEVVKSRGGKALLIEGESGSGKSRLLQEFVKKADLSKALDLIGNCNEQSKSVPLGFVRSIIDDFIARTLVLPPEDKSKWIERVNQASVGLAVSLADLSPGFTELVGAKRTVERLNDDYEKQRLLEAFCEFLVRLSSLMEQMLIQVDDAQWLDPLSRELLSRISEGADRSRILLVMTCGDSRVSAEENKAMRTQLGSKLEVISLNALTREDVEALVSAQLGARGIDSEAVSRIISMSQGNPFATIELIRALLNSDGLKINGDKWEVDLSRMSDGFDPTNAYKFVFARINQLGPEDRKALIIAAMIGDEFDIPAISNLAKIPEDAATDFVQRMLGEKLIQALDAGKFSLFSDRIRAHLMTLIDQEQAAAHYDDLARYFDSKPDDKKRWFEIARYYNCSKVEKTTPSAYRANATAGRLALNDCLYQVAYEHLSTALGLGKSLKIDSSALKDLAMDLATAAGNSGREIEAYEALEFAYERAETSAEVASILVSRLRIYADYGRVNHAWNAFKQASDELGYPYPVFKFQRWSQISVLGLKAAFKLITGIGFGQGAKSKAKKERLEKLCSAFDVVNRVCHWRVDKESQLWIILSYLNFAHQSGDYRRRARSFAFIGYFLAPYNLIELAKFAFKKAYDAAERAGDQVTKAYLGYVEFASYVGAVDLSSYERAKAIESSVKRYLGPYELSGLAMFGPQSRSFRGYYKEANDWLQEKFQFSNNLNNRLMLAYGLSASYMHLIELGKVAEAVEVQKQTLKFIDQECKDIYFIQFYYMVADFTVTHDQRDHGSDVEIKVDQYERLTGGPGRLSSKYYLDEMARATTPDERRRARLKLKSALRRDFKATHLPVLRLEGEVSWADLARLQGEISKAFEITDRVYKQARENQHVTACFEIALIRARIYEQLGDYLKRDTEILGALALAQKNEWALRGQTIFKEFKESIAAASSDLIGGVGFFPPAGDGSGTHKSRQGSSTRNERTIHANQTTQRRSSVDSRTMIRSQAVTKEERAINALINVGLASLESIDPATQARVVLDEVVKLFGAERAFVFVADAPAPAPVSAPPPAEAEQVAVATEPA